jgi:hypothetical protein
MAVMHDYLCPNGHIFERYTDTSKRKPWRRKCLECGRMADHATLPPTVSRNAQRFTPTVLYQNAEGAVINPGRAVELPKPEHDKLLAQGYSVVRLDTSRKYATAMRRYATHLEQRYETKRAREIAMRRAFHDEQRRRYEPTLRSLQPRQRELALQAFAKLQRGGSDDYKTLRPNVFISSFENDSNSCKWNDRETGFRDRRE